MKTWQISPSSKAKCKMCGNVIKKNDYRFEDDYIAYGGYKKTDYYCLDCGLKVIKDEVDFYQGLYLWGIDKKKLSTGDHLQAEKSVL